MQGISTSLLAGVIALLTILFIFLVCSATGIVLLIWLVRRKSTANRNGDEGKNITIGFFHPYCNAGGGGERVLWTAIRAIQKYCPDVDCAVYTGDIDATEEQILHRIYKRFNISFSRKIKFVFLTKRRWVETSMYPVFTLLGQSVGSLYLGLEALMKYIPDIYVDSMGYAFTLPLFKYAGGCKVACYVHYPTISVDMLDRVSEQKETHNNREIISQSALLTTFKIFYYHVFAALYSFCGQSSDITMVNSSWTKGHIESLWKQIDNTFLVYPPCDVKEFIQIPLHQNAKREICKILSISQFRPEKNHALQIKSFCRLLEMLPYQRKTLKLVLVGSCRNTEDQNLVNTLRHLCKELSVEENVIFRLNVDFSDLKKEMEEATIGIHTMWNEHFGIGVVESIAAGIIMIAHNSGGPKMDIIVENKGQLTGFLAEDAQDYAEIMKNIIQMTADEQIVIRTNAREHITRFSEEHFEKCFLMAISSLLPEEKSKSL